MEERLLHALVAAAREAQASDIHLAAGSPPILRIGGELRPIEHPPLAEEALRRLRDLLLAAGEHGPPSDAAMAQDLDFACTLQDGERYRVNAYRTRRGTALALRRLPGTPPPLEELPAPEAVQALSRRRSGLVLVTGATGSGKSTTLAALLDRINASRRHHIITIEDPIEYLHPNKAGLVSQREVGRHTESFQAALRGALREDPDVILVGEMRDRDTIALALTAAETGQLVLASLHSPTAPQAIDRILDVFPGGEKELVRAMLAGALAAVIGQRLLPRRGGGMVPAMEVMLATSAVRSQIREGKVAQLHQSIELGGSAGMQTMDQAVAELRKAGLITPETAEAHA